MIVQAQIYIAAAIFLLVCLSLAELVEMSISHWGMFDADAPIGEGQLSLMWLNDYFAMCRELSWGFN